VAVAGALHAVSLDVAGDRALAQRAATSLLTALERGNTAWMPTYEDIAYALR
jgi:hypothetical protein